MFLEAAAGYISRFLPFRSIFYVLKKNIKDAAQSGLIDSLLLLRT
jgi:hypothetical protein